MRHIVFIIAYLYFLINDLKKKKISSTAIIIYALVSIIVFIITKRYRGMYQIIDIICSIGFGLIIYLLSYFSNERIGIADGLYFVINGLLLTFTENLVLFLTGLFVAFIVGIFMFIFCQNKREMRLPFMPCLLPVIVGYIVCIV